MATELLFPRSARDRATPVRPDLALLAHPLFLRLAETLRQVERMLIACRAMRNRTTRHRRAWGVPNLLFADAVAQAEWSVKQAEPAAFPEPFVSLLAPAWPDLHGAWERLPDLLDDAFALLSESIDVRRMARAMPGLRAAAESVPQAGELAAILALPEEEVWLVIHPAARAGFRVTLEGVADVAQLHVLLADRITGDPARGYLAGARPHAASLGASRDSSPSRGVVATARFQFYRPEALRPTGALPQGLAGSADWYWGREALNSVPQVHGERILLIGEPVLPMAWEVARRCTRIAARVRVLDVLTMGEVETWIRARCPQYRPALLPVSRAA